jgi:peptide/nickel transport system substrate-binding protein
MFWDRYARARITRRRALQAGGAMIAGAAAFGLAGCDDAPSVPPDNASVTPGDPSKPDILNLGGPPRHGGRLVTANAADFGTFDPHLGIAVASAYFPRVYNLLVNQSASKPEFIFHDLAESFEIPDDQTFIFKLRPGVKIAPNTLAVPERDLDGDDVRVTLERIKAEGAATNHTFARDHIESVTVAGDVVTIKTPEPYAWFLNRLGLFLNTIAPRELMAGDLARLSGATAGAGPYRLISVTEGEAARFQRNPNYYRTDPENNNARLPYIDELEVRVVYDKATQRAAFLSGQVHAYMSGSSADVRSLSDAVIARDPFFAYNSFTMNPKRAPFGDPRVRRAISRAIDRKAFVDLVYGGDAQADGLVQWSLGSYALPPDELDALQPFDLEEARRLVAEVGGIKLNMMYPASTPILEHQQHLPVFIEQMRKAGIEVEQDAQNFALWVENLRKINYDCTLNLNQQYETPEIPLAIHTSSGPFGDGTYLAGLGDAEIEAAVRKTARELDTEARVQLVRDAQRLIYAKDPISLPLVTPFIHTAWRKNVKNIPTGVGTSSFLINTHWIET